MFSVTCVHMNSELTTWYWITNWEGVPLGRPFSIPVVLSGQGLRPPDFSPLHVTCPLCCHHCSGLVVAAMLMRLHGCSLSDISRRHSLTQSKLPVPLAVKSFHHALFHNDFWALDSGVHASAGLGYHTITCSLGFDTLWFYIMVSVSQRSFFREGWEPHLSVSTG